MKTIIKLLMTAAILNAVVRSGMSAWDYYQLKDAAQQLLVFGDQASIADLQNGILSKAAELDVPLAPENVNVRREGVRTIAEASYTHDVEFFPTFRYPVNYTFRVEAFSSMQQERR
jgi:hypothetical protein